MGKFRFTWDLETLKNCIFTCFQFILMRLFYLITTWAGLPVALQVCSLLYTSFNIIFSVNRFYFSHLLVTIQKCDWKQILKPQRVFLQIYRMCFFINLFHVPVIGYCYLSQKGQTGLYLRHLMYKYLELWVCLDAFPKNFFKTTELSIC